MSTVTSNLSSNAWEGDWAETWEPQVNLENAKGKIDAFVASGSRGPTQVRQQRTRAEGD